MDQNVLSPGRTSSEGQREQDTYLKHHRYRLAEPCKFQDSIEDEGHVGLVVARRTEK